MITMTEQSSVTAPTFVASALRFSDDPPAMKGFLEALGLSVEISKGSGWFTLKGRSGEVSLHASGARSATNAPGGRTDLVLVTPDARAAAESLEAQGLSATILGRVLRGAGHGRDPGWARDLDQRGADTICTATSSTTRSRTDRCGRRLLLR